MDISRTKYCRAPDIETHDAEDGLVVFNPATDRIHHLNFTAGILFELCQEPHDAGELAAMLVELYGLATTPWEETKNGLMQLVAEGILVEVDLG